MSYEVYKLLFVRMVELEHVGLFVKTEAKSGILFHAIGDPASSTSKILAMQFQMIPCSPWNSPTVLDIKLIGGISKDRFNDLQELCKSTPHPIGRRNSRDRPNCWSWFYNVVYDLHDQEIVNFSDPSVIPAEKPPLQSLPS